MPRAKRRSSARDCIDQGRGKSKSRFDRGTEPDVWKLCGRLTDLEGDERIFVLGDRLGLGLWSCSAWLLKYSLVFAHDFVEGRASRQDEMGSFVQFAADQCKEAQSVANFWSGSGTPCKQTGELTILHTLERCLCRVLVPHSAFVSEKKSCCKLGRCLRRCG